MKIFIRTFISEDALLCSSSPSSALMSRITILKFVEAIMLDLNKEIESIIDYRVIYKQD